MTRTSPTPKLSPPSPASPAATSGSCTAFSCRSNASSRSTASRSSRMMLSKPPAARSSSASHSAEEIPPLISEGRNFCMPFQSRCIRKLAGLPDHLVCLEEERRGDGEAERLGSLEIDNELELGGLLHRQ